MFFLYSNRHHKVRLRVESKRMDKLEVREEFFLFQRLQTYATMLLGDTPLLPFGLLRGVEEYGSFAPRQLSQTTPV